MSTVQESRFVGEVGSAGALDLTRKKGGRPVERRDGSYNKLIAGHGAGHIIMIEWINDATVICSLPSPQTAYYREKKIMTIDRDNGFITIFVVIIRWSWVTGFISFQYLFTYTVFSHFCIRNGTRDELG